MNHQVNQVLQKAKRSFKIFSTFEKQTLAKARTFIRIPSSTERKEMTRDRILTSLKRMGVATQSDVDALHQKIQSLEAALRKKTKPASSKSRAK